METKLIWITPNAENLIAYIARVSSANQDNPEYARLIKYMLDHHHWSPFEMVNACVEIVTSRAIARQILRHRSFSFQEFSQRYATVQTFMPVYARRQTDKNRQSSIDDLPGKTQAWFQKRLGALLDDAEDLYEEAIKRGIAKESARFVLPECAASRLYMNGSLRSWIHYINLRTQPDTQLEHQKIARAIQRILSAELPTLASALGWTSAPAVFTSGDDDEAINA